MKNARIVLLVLFGLGTLWGQVVPPQIGFASDLTGAFRPVLGVAGNFLLGDPVAQSVLSSGFSGTFAFVKTDAALSIIDAGIKTDFPAAPGPALFSFSGHSGFAYFVSDGTLHRWDGIQLTTVPLNTFDGQVLALAQSDATHVSFAVCQNAVQVDVLQFDGVTGALEASTPLTNTAGNLALLNEREFIFVNDGGLLLRFSNGTEVALSAQVKGDVSFEQLAAGWWSVKDSNGRHYALRVQRGHEMVYQLPENTQ